ncbi:MAG TPA: DNA repair protein RecN [Polyangiaceae bacterium]|nr:DNA repair protein RecN [Polyangiaceae bacterium]
MLSCLRIRDLAIIDELELELGSGLNVLTGETGSGKSILVSALELVLGGKSRGELVRTGAKAAEVEALFDVSGDAGVRQQLQALGIDAEDELVVRRVLSSCGRSRAFVNGQLATQQVLARITRGLTDISSQHEHHTLTDPSTHLGFLDAFAGAGPLRQQVTRAYHTLKEAENQLADFEKRSCDREARLELLKSQVDDIESAALHPGEDVELEQTCTRLRSVDNLLRLTGKAADLLYEQDESVLSGLAGATRRLSEAAALDTSLASIASQLELLRSQLDDTARDLGRKLTSLRPDPDALHKAEERLYLLAKLKRRFGGSVESVRAHLVACRVELDELNEQVTTREALEGEQTRAFDGAATSARKLSSERQRAATRLAAAISTELGSLGMGGARVHVELSPLDGEAAEIAIDGARLSPDGLERVEFLLAPNRGEEARPLSRIASGGELSRAMLAIKCVLADLGPAGMYVFDEVDSGVGGGMAEIIGRKIRSVAQHRQVLCVTHLPQIAVFADQHFKVEKVVRGERTLSTVRRLTRKEQQEEIARMLGGLRITAKTRAAARELLLQARHDAA